MLEMQDKSQAYSNPIWDYFSGYDYDSRLLIDYGLMNKEKYTDFIKVLRSEYKQTTQSEHLRLNLSALMLCIYDGTMSNPDTKEPFIHNTEAAFVLMTNFYTPLKLRQIEIGMLPRISPKIMTDDKFEAYHKLISHNFSRQNANGADFVNALDFISGTIFNLATQASNQATSPQKRKQALSCIEMFMNEGTALLPNLANTVLLDMQSGMMEVLFQQDSKLRKPLTNFCFMTNMAFDLTKKPLSDSEILNRKMKALDLIDKAIVYEPFVSLDKKVAFFDEISKIKSQVNKQIKKVATHSISDILAQRGGYERR